jgi:hypothetical protein
VGLVSKPYTFEIDDVIRAAEHNSNADSAITEINGKLENVNFADGAAIAETKLNSIATANRVAGSALFNLNLTPSGANIIPHAHMPSGTGATQVIKFATAGTLPVATGSNLTGIKFSNVNSGYWEIDLATAPFTTTVTGVGFQPKLLLTFTTIDGETTAALGMAEQNGSQDFVGQYQDSGGTGRWVNRNAVSGLLSPYVSWMLKWNSGNSKWTNKVLQLNSFNSDGFVIDFFHLFGASYEDWTSGTIRQYYVALG